MSSTTIYQQRLARVRVATASHLTGMWDQLPNLDRPQAERFAAAAVPVVAAAQKLTARNVTGYLAPKIGLKVPKFNPDLITGAAVRKGVDPLEEYQRPFGVVWGALSDGVPYEEAVARGRDRLGVLAVTDVWLAMRATSDLVGQSKPGISWVRVADASACDLCAAADGLPMDQAGDMAGHPGCGCTAEPVQGDPPPDTSDASAIDVHENDELGPVLYQAGHQFSG